MSFLFDNKIEYKSNCTGHMWYPYRGGTKYELVFWKIAFKLLYQNPITEYINGFSN